MKRKLIGALPGRILGIGLIAGAIAISYYAGSRSVKLSSERNISYQVENFNKDSDEILLARMLYGETGGKLSLEETVAIANTAIRRSKDGKKWNGETLRGSILAPKQYSCFNGEDPMLPRLKNPYANNPKSFDRCLEIAEGIFNGKYQDTSKGATHYFNPKICSPSWAKAMQKIGYLQTSEGQSAHVFYKELSSHPHKSISKSQIVKAKQKYLPQKKLSTKKSR